MLRELNLNPACNAFHACLQRFNCDGFLVFAVNLTEIWRYAKPNGATPVGGAGIETRGRDARGTLMGKFLSASRGRLGDDVY